MGRGCDWREDVLSALNDFSTVSGLAGDKIVLESGDIEFLPAPHKPPSRLPADRMAVYGFWFDGSWLKVGKVGPKSSARYTSQHYTGSAQSTLAGSIGKDASMQAHIAHLGGYPLADWIARETSRVNILLPAARRKSLLSLLESFLHMRLRPRYEG